jgi:hypothetical protein
MCGLSVSSTQVSNLTAELDETFELSRNRVTTMGCLKQLIDALGALHYNELQLYTEHTFAYQGHKTVWQSASPMTAAEILELDAYCAEGVKCTI